jgi:hypothetical protein
MPFVWKNARGSLTLRKGNRNPPVTRGVPLSHKLRRGKKGVKTVAIPTQRRHSHAAGPSGSLMNLPWKYPGPFLIHLRQSPTTPANSLRAFPPSTLFQGGGGEGRRRPRGKEGEERGGKEREREQPTQKEEERVKDRGGGRGWRGRDGADMSSLSSNKQSLTLLPPLPPPLPQIPSPAYLATPPCL